jgi:hypothetical protein
MNFHTCFVLIMTFLVPQCILVDTIMLALSKPMILSLLIVQEFSSSSYKINSSHDCVFQVNYTTWRCSRHFPWAAAASKCSGGGVVVEPRSRIWGLKDFMVQICNSYDLDSVSSVYPKVRIPALAAKGPCGRKSMVPIHGPDTRIHTW